MTACTDRQMGQGAAIDMTVKPALYGHVVMQKFAVNVSIKDHGACK